jgi:Leucine-rich repeat (LRR) protein
MRSCFKKLREFEVRNNLLTALSCKIIVNNLSFLHSLDIRGNRVGDSGIETVAKGFPQLKNLLISETGTTD